MAVRPRHGNRPIRGGWVELAVASRWVRKPIKRDCSSDCNLDCKPLTVLVVVPRTRCPRPGSPEHATGTEMPCGQVPRIHRLPCSTGCTRTCGHIVFSSQTGYGLRN